MRDLWLMILTVGGIFVFALVCGLHGRKKTVVIDPVKDLGKIGVDFTPTDMTVVGVKDNEITFERTIKLDPETVRQEMLDQLSLRAAGDKLSELKRRKT